jgi:hypothetical protein
MNSISLLLLLALVSSTISAPSYFLPFGPSAGDSTLFRNDDSYSNSIPFTFNFQYFGNVIQNLYVDNNGIISFEGPVGTYTPSGLSSVSFPIVAPYWTDVDTRCSTCGFVYYRETSNVADLAIINAFVRATKNPSFNAAQAFSITWDSVGYYNEHSDKTDTFQAILVADETGYSAVIFNYGIMQFTTGDASGGHDGLGGIPAVVGFSSGNGLYVQMPGSLTSEILNIGQSTNAYINGIPQIGQYIFYVSNEPSCVNSVCCDSNNSTDFIGIPEDTTISQSAPIPAVPTVIYFDTCSNQTCNYNLVPMIETQSGNTCPYTITRKWTFTDSCCRTHIASQTINVVCSLPSTTGMATPSTTGSSLTPTQFCATVDRTQWSPLYQQGYYCSGNGFIQCWGNIQGAYQPCPQGTQCTCQYGIECSNFGSKSPCV